MVKKISALLIALLIISSFSVISFAASANISADTVHGNKGDRVTVAVKLNSNPGFACLKLFAEYDAAALELENAFDEGLMGVASFKNIGTGKYYFSWGEKGERHLHYTKTGDLVTLVFKITDMAKDARYEIKFSYDKDFADDVNGDPVTVTFTNGAVVVGSGGSTVSPTSPVQTEATAAPTSPPVGKTDAVSSTQKSTTKPATSAPSNSQKTTQGATQKNTNETTTVKSGETPPTAVNYTNITAEGKNETVRSSPEAEETVTDENGSTVPEVSETEQTEDVTAGTDTVETEPQSGSKLKMVIIIIVLLLVFALILLLARSGRSKRSEN